MARHYGTTRGIGGRRIHGRRIHAWILVVAMLAAWTVALGSAPAWADARVKVRVEGADSTVWAGSVNVGTSVLTDKDGATHTVSGKALCTLDEAARLGAFPYQLQSFAWGLFIDGVNDEWSVLAPPYPGWLYRVNGVSPPVGADALDVSDGDEVLWYYGTYDASPVAVAVSSRALPVGNVLTVRARQLDAAGAATPLPGATVHVGSLVATADAAGEVTVTMNAPGTFGVRAHKAGHIRSGIQYVRVGERAHIVSFSAWPRRVRYPGRVRFTGRLVSRSGGIGGEVVRIQARTPGTRTWRTVRLDRTDAWGRFHAWLVPPRTSFCRAIWLGDSTHLPAYGPARLVLVRR